MLGVKFDQSICGTLPVSSHFFNGSEVERFLFANRTRELELDGLRAGGNFVVLLNGFAQAAFAVLLEPL